MDTPPARGARPLPPGWHKLRVERLLLLFRHKLLVVTECTVLQSTAPNFTGLECSYVIPLEIRPMHEMFADQHLVRLIEASNGDPRFGKLCDEARRRRFLLKGGLPWMLTHQEAAFVSEPEKYDEKVVIDDVVILANVQEKQLRTTTRTVNVVYLAKELP